MIKRSCFNFSHVQVLNKSKKTNVYQYLNYEIIHYLLKYEL
jgi:hypothetical protein